MEVFGLRDKLISDYATYVRSFVTIRDARIEKLVDEALEGGALWPAPLLQVSPSFEVGESLDALVAAKELEREAVRIFARKREDGTIEAPLRLFRHQVEGLRAARRREPYVLTTGTGSGKSLSYIVPIVDEALRKPGRGHIRAIVVYPMNALANSQEGELEKYLQRGYRERLVTFARYTGQDDEAARKRIVEDPPDILLTNYVMLELMLTRPKEAALVRAGEGLSFLVFDELHTYRGRQGADVALLIRRARAAFKSPDLLCAGTSATMSTKGSWTEQQAEIAAVASAIFGTAVKPTNVIGESLVRATPELPDDVDTRRVLADAIADRGAVASLTLAELEQNPIVRWLEGTVGVRREPAGRLVRATPVPFGDEGLVGKLSSASGMQREWCHDALLAVLESASRTVRPDGRPLFGLRLHQFLSKGDTVYASIEAEAARHLTLHAQVFVPGTERTKILLPLAFCRECGQEYYVVRRRQVDGTTVVYEKRDLGDFNASQGQPGFLFVSAVAPWPTERQAILERLPDTWLDGDEVSSSMKKREPRAVSVAAGGQETKPGVGAAFVPAPFGFCLSCGVAYSTRQTRDFGKLATLGSEGRSTATTILSLSAIRRLREDESVQPTAQKLLTFTDNRQDASLQAGHFNDFVEIVQLRSALAAAVAKAPAAGLRHDELPQKVFEELALPLSSYALNDQVMFAQRRDVDAALREAIGYRLFVDQRRGWRLTSPNLEQCGLLEVEYDGLLELCKEETFWQDTHPALAGELSGQREAICQVLLDYLRRELAIAVPFLDLGWQEAAATRSYHQLQSSWVLPAPDGLQQASIVFARSRPKQGRLSRDWAFLSPRGGFAQWLKKKGLVTATADDKLKTPDVEQILKDLIDKLLKASFLVPKEPLDKLTGVQLAPGVLRFRPGDGLSAAPDPLRVSIGPGGGRTRVNASFVDLYRAGPATFSALEAREHTAQVANDRREEREDRFRQGKLPILYCSPTMELGVDIAQLDVVGLRNVPPSPANYAQRSGRAGRSGQPALVFTYCSAGSPHDQHYFRRPEKMVAGIVAAPRLDLGNEDLVRAHVHAVWLAASGLDLGQSMKDVLDVSGESPTLSLLDRIRAALEDQDTRDRAASVARAALGDALAEVANKEAVDVWLGRALREVPKRFESACERWKSLYRAAHGQQLRQNRITLDASRDAKERDAATRLRQQAETQLRLLTEIDTRGNSDFYVYRYLASEGFLPGYAFPRLPLSAYIEGQRGKKGTEAYLSRPRFIAISEFGPRSLIYHEGNRYAVTRVALPMGPGDGLEKTRATICEVCGYLHPRGDDPGSDLCERCGQPLPPVIPNLFRMQNVTTKRRDRISSDEEERQRLGFEILTTVRFADRSDHGSARETQLVDAEGDSLCTLVHGDSATLWRINVGWRRRASKEERGFLLDIERGIWAKRSTDPSGADDPEDDGPQEAMSKQVERVIPFVGDTRNCLLVSPAGNPSAKALISLGYALQGAIARVFQLEERELAVEVLPTVEKARTVLLYEASEGGAGVLSRLVSDRDDLNQVIDSALDLAHFDPATGVDRGVSARGEPCEAGCYECLLSYFNQRHHEAIDRRLVEPLLRAWRNARFESSAALAPRGEHLDRLLRLTESELERRFLRLLDERGHRLPSAARLVLGDSGVRADFAYEDELFVVFVDGPQHDEPEQKQADREAEESLLDAGYTVLRFHHQEDWGKKLDQLPGIFGRATSTPPPR